ncbi:2-amino-4-hydroxy-6-hydroxymethyldihydropteridine diphosphokinase [Sulfitobacter pseudonitzschiae]|uniref:2-amino-4-hydroxy-6-hydroxymethyldihydropteridine pyrophosphokinase n=1 Tax=Pseudosulfitobacter pseudonitzschiae TaxID=1402135 RepID=A0A9Q2NL04_9RHOB|nr:2-amino-4-hydroxy-6-hydroxymethyldihydropteridine diphosphokinase [Pseudosulfitobacter pseudonitzschiae]MBM2292633.1 2-amino-4-hydroxy-6-hydroxymethyldihydropteridine diphosphokinase [Pseudosulfitobacter pseudonitzschiae]MBM2297550.1 2-amino-4-hydroxy-6-hydroxymethyldihydropteridine diphosphokinase [Pseudosulfitobacter pseudonitzschiae]MBM2302464.1 2-amino-4-hydroxy-6-hydroxymethyldihydropteridine diphosphokinase [Pseudosulfitobacter pseudonitzschiae]MBM2312247.1 2-amino-4-hydroxy-6-hydroxym
MQFRSDILIAVGSNQRSFAGTPEETLKTAYAQLELAGGVIRKASPFYATPCFPAGAGPDYVNAALSLKWNSAPGDIIAALHRIEADLGRERVQRWGQRTVDLDLIAVGDLVLPDRETYTRWRDLPLAQQMKETPDRLILPHPRMHERAFVLVPLADVEPDWVHPVTGQTVVQMRDALDPALRAEVVPL